MVFLTFSVGRKLNQNVIKMWSICDKWMDIVTQTLSRSYSPNASKQLPCSHPPYQLLPISLTDGLFRDRDPFKLTMASFLICDFNWKYIPSPHCSISLPTINNLRVHFFTILIRIYYKVFSSSHLLSDGWLYNTWEE